MPRNLPITLNDLYFARQLPDLGDDVRCKNSPRTADCPNTRQVLLPHERVFDHGNHSRRNHSKRSCPDLDTSFDVFVQAVVSKKTDVSTGEQWQTCHVDAVDVTHWDRVNNLAPPL